MVGLFNKFTAGHEKACTDCTTAYVPILPREIPRNSLEHIVVDWFDPELSYAKAYINMQDAIDQQKQYINFQRFPNTDALFIIVEVQVMVPALIPDEEEGIVRIMLEAGLQVIHALKAHVTSKLIPGSLVNEDEKNLPGDVPFDGTIHETIEISFKPNQSLLLGRF